MYVVTTKGFGGSKVEVEASCEGEMLDRVRYAMESPFVESVTVTKEINHG